VIQKLVSQYQLTMALGTPGAIVNVIDFSATEAGLYVSGRAYFTNAFGTRLLARGPRAALEARSLLADRGH
jgi:hypothetical protein